MNLELEALLLAMTNMMARDALGIPELVSQIATHLHWLYLFSFICVNRLFYEVGTPHLWKKQRRLGPLLKVGELCLMGLCTAMFFRFWTSQFLTMVIGTDFRFMQGIWSP